MLSGSTIHSPGCFATVVSVSVSLCKQRVSRLSPQRFTVWKFTLGKFLATSAVCLTSDGVQRARRHSKCLPMIERAEKCSEASVFKGIFSKEFDTVRECFVVSLLSVRPVGYSGENMPNRLWWVSWRSQAKDQVHVWQLGRAKSDDQTLIRLTVTEIFAVLIFPARN